MMKSRELKTKIYSHAHSLILPISGSLSLSVCHSPSIRVSAPCCLTSTVPLPYHDSCQAIAPLGKPSRNWNDVSEDMWRQRDEADGYFRSMVRHSGREVQRLRQRVTVAEVERQRGAEVQRLTPRDRATVAERQR